MLITVSQALQIHQLEVASARDKQVIVCAMLHYPALIKDVDHIGFLNRGESMRYSNGGPPLGCSVECCLDNFFRIGV